MGNLTSDDVVRTVHSEEEYAPVKMVVAIAGAPIVNEGSAILYAGDKNCAAIYVDLRSKRCEVISTGSDAGVPLIDIMAGEHSLHLDTGKTGFTEIQFPDYAGWSVFSADIGRYTLAVCLVKGRNEATP